MGKCLPKTSKYGKMCIRDSRMGYAAVRALMDGKTNRVVVFDNNQAVSYTHLVTMHRDYQR